MNYMNSNCTTCSINSRDISAPNTGNVTNMSIAMAYVPWQTWGNIYDLDKGFCVGTIFPCLDKPFIGRCACK